MDSETFFLKYRPQCLKDLDKKDIREGLTKLVKSGKRPPAFLFAGPKGIGKTSAARILAKAINCEKRLSGPAARQQRYEPCNRCEICQSITNGTALDLIEIDGASNRGIDDIRNLRQKIKLSPAKARYKVYIIDEVHMLTTEAFNALLKTLEEPPQHALFVLCTTAPEKLPETIVSRCLRFNFQQAQPKEIMRSLKKVVKGEKLKVEKGVLEAVAGQAEGSFRDAQKILDQLAAGGKKITLKETLKILGQIESWLPEKLLLFLAQKELKSALGEIDRVVAAGADLAVFTQNLLEQLRQALLAQVGLPQDKLFKAAETLSLREIQQLIRLFSQAANELRFTPIPQLPLELAVVDYCLEPDGNLRSPLAKKNPHKTSHNLKTANGGVQLKKVVSKWPEVMAKVKPMNHSVEALLRASRPVEANGQKLTLEVFYKFHKERLETEKCRRIVEEAAAQVLGTPVQLFCRLGEKKKFTAPADSSAPSTNSDKDDIVNAAKEIFSGELIY